MRAIEIIKKDIAVITNLLNNIEDFTDGREFTTKEFNATHSYCLEGGEMSALVHRGIAKVVGEKEYTYKREIYLGKGKYAMAEIPYTAKVYSIVHDIEWYKAVLLYSLTQIING